MKLAFYFLTVKYVAVKNMTTYIQFRAPTLIHAEAPTALPSIAFAPSLQISTKWKRQTAYYYCENGFVFVDTLEEFPESFKAFFISPTSTFYYKKVKIYRKCKKAMWWITIFLYLDWSPPPPPNRHNYTHSPLPLPLFLFSSYMCVCVCVCVCILYNIFSCCIWK